MTLSELLGHLRCNVLRDTAQPQLWSDTELIRYLNLAQVEFCRRTFALTDGSSSFTTFNTVAGDGAYLLDKRIVFIAEAWTVGRDNPDDVTEITSVHPLRDGARGQVPVSVHKGRPACWTAQIGTGMIRLHPVPDDVYEVQMIVSRKPLRDMADAKDIPEIDEEYHIPLCDFAAWRALTNNDPEGANMSSAKEFRAAWDLTIRDVRRDMARMRLGPKPQARANWTGKTYHARYR